MKVIAENLLEGEIQGLKQTFNSMDTDGSGTITLEELKVGLHKLGSKLTESEIEALMEAVRTKLKSLFRLVYSPKREEESVN